jgi:hypothetical protein
VCSRCGMTVHQWGASRGWKHAAGGPKVGCGARPVEPMTRTHFHEEVDAEIDVLHRNGWGIDEAREEVIARRKADG